MDVALQQQFGDIDIYVFDQLLRGRIAPGMRVLDAGCGSGRNLVYLMRSGHEVFGVDADSAAIQSVRRLATRVAPHLTPDNFRVEAIEQMTFPEASVDAVLSSAVLHFARDDGQFDAMLGGMWKVLAPGGLLFLGHAEAGVMKHTGLVSIAHAAYQRSTGAGNGLKKARR